MYMNQINLSKHCYIVDWGYSLRLYSFNRSLLEWSKDTFSKWPLSELCCGYTSTSYTIQEFIQKAIEDYSPIQQSHIRMFIKYIKRCK